MRWCLSCKLGGTTQKRCQLIRQRWPICDFAFPYHQNLPSSRLEEKAILLIAAFVIIKFFEPELHSRSRNRRPAAAFMGVPKASMNKNDLFGFAKYQVRLAGQRSNVQPVSPTQTPDNPPNRQFGLGVRATDETHSRASLLDAQEVNTIERVMAYCLQLSVLLHNLLRLCLLVSTYLRNLLLMSMLAVDCLAC